jgi:hypothetical protein
MSTATASMVYKPKLANQGWLNAAELAGAACCSQLLHSILPPAVSLCSHSLVRCSVNLTVRYHCNNSLDPSRLHVVVIAAAHDLCAAQVTAHLSEALLLAPQRLGLSSILAPQLGGPNPSGHVAAHLHSRRVQQAQHQLCEASPSMQCFQ